MSRPVYLVRHGQSRWNVLRRTQGQIAHPPLTALGRVQATAAGELIVADLDRLGFAPARIVSSDLTRAIQTAELIGARLGVGHESDARLREQHLGALEGRSYAETWAAAEQHDWSDPEAPIAGGESPAQVRRRMSAVLSELDPGQVTVLVSHGDAIRLAIAELVESDEKWIEVPNGAVARFDGELTWLTPPTCPDAATG